MKLFETESNPFDPLPLISVHYSEKQRTLNGKQGQSLHDQEYQPTHQTVSHPVYLKR